MLTFLDPPVVICVHKDLVPTVRALSAVCSGGEGGPVQAGLMEGVGRSLAEAAVVRGITHAALLGILGQRPS